MAIVEVFLVNLVLFQKLNTPQAGEIEGLDIHEHGMPAYPEFVMMGRFNQARTPTQLIPQSARTKTVPAAGDD